MSDEYLNNDEETSALFVSAKKKKMAEEEAARKAAEEQARREAAEAEVLRMEAEVKERKRKAEEEKKALEEQEKQLAEEKISRAKGAVSDHKAAKEPKKRPAEKPAGGVPKLPIFIGIGVVAVVAIVLVLVFKLKKGGSNATVFDPATTEFNAEYVCKEEGFDLKFSYPDSIYTEVTEEKTGDEEVTIHFGGADVILSTYKYDGTEDKILMTDAWVYPAQPMQKGFQEKVAKRIKEIAPDMKVLNEKGVDVGADDAVKYGYKCSFESAESGNGAATAWIEPNSAGECKRVIVCVKGAGANTDECAKICDVFEEKNSATALYIPGGNPPTATDSDGMLEIDEMHMGLPVPKDVFSKYPKPTNFSFYEDKNGAAVIVVPVDVGGDILDSMSVESIEELFKKYAERGVNDYYGSCDSRMFMDDDYVAEETGLYYTANYKDMIGGVAFWERFRAGYWFDERQQKDYFYILITLAPEKNEDVYKPIFDKMLDRMKDL